MNILIVKTSAIGDVIHTLPALVCLRKQYPEARIDWLVEEAAADAVIGHWAVDRVLVSHRKQWIKSYKTGKRVAAWRDFWKFVKELRATKYDLVIDFQGLLKSGTFVFLARASRKVGFGKGMEHAEGSWLFLNERIPPVAMDLHALKRELKLLEAMSIPCEEVVFDFPIGDDAKVLADTLLKESGVDLQKPFIAINPMTTWPTKHWYAARFAELADQLSALGFIIIFTGGPLDRPEIKKITDATKRISHNLAGKTNLKTLAALYQRAALVISTDTGPMHIAAAVGAPVVALFGPTAPWRTGPFGDKNRVLRMDLPCSPCFKKKCDRGRACMAEITTEWVFKEATSILQHHGRPE